MMLCGRILMLWMLMLYLNITQNTQRQTTSRYRQRSQKILYADCGYSHQRRCCASFAVFCCPLYLPLYSTLVHLLVPTLLFRCADTRSSISIRIQAKAVCCTHLRLRLSAAELGAPPSSTASGSFRTSFSCRHRLNWQRHKASVQAR